VVSRTWRKVNGDWDACNARSLVHEPVVRLILDGRSRATSVSLLVALGVRADGQKVLLTRALSLPRSSSIGTPYTAGQRS
jgi:putative transposase